MTFKLGSSDINSGFVTSRYDEVIPPLVTREPWVRPSSWIDIPANPNGDNVFYGILPVYDTDQEVVINTCFQSINHLDSFKPTLINTNISFNGSTLMASGAIDQVAEALESGVNGTAGFTNVDIYSNQISLMTSKGWTVTT